MLPAMNEVRSALPLAAILALSATFSLGPVAFGAGTLACGGQQPAPVGPVPVASAKPSVPAPQIVPGLGGDTSAVPEPKNLVVVGRIASLGKALKSVHAWSQLPMPK